ncbi:MAG: DUF1624 domain-containing protein, partial [Firmicutes bacterium]|nr:DUF1624 domain-containing protein [Bacillota bacterium]
MAAVRNNERVVGIDAARGLAILLMVFSHGLHWVYTGTSHDLILLFGTLSVGDLAAPIFFTVAGLSLYLSVTSKLRKGVEPLTLVNRYRHRFAQIFFVGVCLSLYWGVLQAQAIALFAVASL